MSPMLINTQRIPTKSKFHSSILSILIGDGGQQNTVSLSSPLIEHFHYQTPAVPYDQQQFILNEDVPLNYDEGLEPLLPHDYQKQPKSYSVQSFFFDIATGFPAALLALLLNLLDAMSYGIIIFPPKDLLLPANAAQSGISMFLARFLLL